MPTDSPDYQPADSPQWQQREPLPFKAERMSSAQNVPLYKMITTRTNVIQQLTATGWLYVFCWSKERGVIVTTNDYRKAQPAGNLGGFREMSPKSIFRITTWKQAAVEAKRIPVDAKVPLVFHCGYNPTNDIAGARNIAKAMDRCERK